MNLGERSTVNRRNADGRTSSDVLRVVRDVDNTTTPRVADTQRVAGCAARGTHRAQRAVDDLADPQIRQTGVPRDGVHRLVVVRCHLAAEGQTEFRMMEVK